MAARNNNRFFCFFLSSSRLSQIKYKKAHNLTFFMLYFHRLIKRYFQCSKETHRIQYIKVTVQTVGINELQINAECSIKSVYNQTITIVEKPLLDSHFNSYLSLTLSYLFLSQQYLKAIIAN